MLTTHYRGFKLEMTEYRTYEAHDRAPEDRAPEVCYCVEIMDPGYSYYDDGSQEPGYYFEEVFGRFFDITFFRATQRCDEARGIDFRPVRSVLMSDN